MRGSDPDAAVYWLMRMLEAGEDPLFVARRMVIFAAEDVGNADPQALQVAVAAKDAVHFVGLPEGRIPLAQAAIYLATAPKSNAAYARHARRRRGRASARRAAGAAPPAQRADAAHEGPRLRRAATSTRTTTPDAVVEQEYLPDALARPPLLRADRPGPRARDRERLRELAAARRDSGLRRRRRVIARDAAARLPGFSAWPRRQYRSGQSARCIEITGTIAC